MGPVPGSAIVSHGPQECSLFSLRLRLAGAVRERLRRWVRLRSRRRLPWFLALWSSWRLVRGPRLRRGRLRRRGRRRQFPGRRIVFRQMGLRRLISRTGAAEGEAVRESNVAKTAHAQPSYSMQRKLPPLLPVMRARVRSMS